MNVAIMKEDKTKVVRGRNILIGVMLLAGVLGISFAVRIAGIQRTKSVDYHPDEGVLAIPIQQIANTGQVGLKTHYKWPGCGVIYPVGYGMYFLKPMFGEYDYITVLKTLRVLSAIASLGAVAMVFEFLRKYHSVRAGFLGAIFLGVSTMPAIAAHYATLDSVTMLLFIASLYFVYGFFHVDKDGAKVNVVKTFSIGALIGYAISVKWTLMLMAIPVFVEAVGGFIDSVKNNTKLLFLKTGMQKGSILGLGMVVGFLLFFPDFQLVPNKAIEGIQFEMKHHNTGHYGEVLSDPMGLAKKFKRTYNLFVKCGWKAFTIAGLCSMVFVFFKRNRLKWFLFAVFILWTSVPFRNLISPPRHYLVPYIILLLSLAILADYLLSLRVKAVRIASIACLSLAVLASLLYTCISVSPFWMADPRYACAEWIMDNVPKGSGVTWAPRHSAYNWSVPGTRIAGFLFKEYPRLAEPGKYQYLIASPIVLGVYKQHPPDRKIVPEEWFPGTPPSQQELELFYQLNEGGGDQWQRVEAFRSKPQFLGLTYKIFGEPEGQEPTVACKKVFLYKSKYPMARR